MPISSIDTLVSRKCFDFYRRDTFALTRRVATTGTLFTGQLRSMQSYSSLLRAMPSSLPTGVSQFGVTQIDITTSAARGLMVGKMVKMGTLDLATPTFTDGSAAPTVIEGGISRQRPSAILAIVETALNATPGSISVTYVDQSVNAAEASPSTALTASAAVGTCGFVPLNGTDTGAIDITTATRTGGTTPTGVIGFWHFTPVTKAYSARIASNIYKANMISGEGVLCTLGVNERLGVFGYNVTAGGIMGFVDYVGLA